MTIKYTYRELFTKLLPEPYRSQAIANGQEQNRNVDIPEETTGVDPGSLDDVVSCAFFWAGTPEGYDYWRDAAEGEFQTPELRLEVGKRYLTRDGRTAEVVGEDRVFSPESCYRFDGAVEGDTGLCWSITGRYESQRENPLDLVSEIVEAPAPTCDQRLADLESRIAVLEDKLAPVAEEPAPVAVDPGEGYRLLEEGETILDGDEEADGEEGGGWSVTHEANTGDTFTKDSWYPVRRKLPARYPTTPLPEGFDRWECRGKGWNPGVPVTYVHTLSPDHTRFGSVCEDHIPWGALETEYWEAVKDAPLTYRLLNPGEIIQEGDEGYLQRASWVWESMAGDSMVGHPHNPRTLHPVRRPLKTYEDT